jgi:hypothetical protein
MKTGTAVAVFVFLCLGLSAAIAGQAEVYTLDFDQSRLESRREFLIDRDYDLLTMRGLDISSSPGRPILPVQTVHVYVPRGKTVSAVRIVSRDTRRLPGEYNLLPGQQEVPLSSTEYAAPVAPDPRIYGMEGPYPAEPVELVTVGSIGGRRIAALRVYPLQYVPAERTVTMNRDLEIEVEFAEAAEAPEIPRETARVRELRNGIVRDLVMNPLGLELDFPERADLDPSVATEYLLICIPNHEDEYSLLRDWKTRKGVPAEIVTTDVVESTYSGRDEAEKIRNCIKDYYLNESLVWAVVTTSFPKADIRGCYCYVGGTLDTGIPCDLYFADMDGDWNQDGDFYWGETNDDVDLYSDVYVGRIPTNLGVTSAAAVEKVLTYEGCYPLPTDYQLDMLFMAEWLDGETDAADCKNMIDNESVPARFDPITKLYESSGNLNHTTAMNALNAGPGLINHDGHGNNTIVSIGPHVLSDNDMLTLTNGPRYSVFYTLACDPGNFECVGGCFGRAYIEAEEGGGFFVGNSRYGWYWPGMSGYGTGDLYDRQFFKSMFVRGYEHLGVVHADAKHQRVSQAGTNNTDRWAQFSLNLFGDPETPIWLYEPEVLSASHPATLLTGNHMFNVTVSADGSPVSGARVCLWMDEDIYEVESTDGSGNAEFNIAVQDSGEILVTATMNQYVPYLGSIAAEGEDVSGITDALPLEPGITVSPNPARGGALFSFALPGATSGEVTLSIYDARGRLVESIPATGSEGSTGWSGDLRNGRPAPPGVYFARVSDGRESVATKFILLK